MSVTQVRWRENSESVRSVAGEMQDAVFAIMDDCNTDTTTRKYGGWSVVQGSTLVGDADSLRMYNISASWEDVQESAPEKSWYFPTSVGGTALQCANWSTG